MKDGPDIARLAALIGDPARANMLTALMTGKALTATELAAEAGVTAQTASTHLSKLAEGGLTVERRQGRHKYVSLASDDVAAVLESLMGLAAGTGQTRTRTGPRDAALRKARVCYNHLAGDMGTRMFEAFAARGLIEHGDDDVHLTAAGTAHMAAFGIDVQALNAARAPLCRPCLDWSERRTHLAGSLGRALLSRMETLGWVHRTKGSRALCFSRHGEAAFERWITPPNT
ncbi:MAG: winged helix-turn-helix domain-containing protein [Pseudomonadota bacterium]